MVHSVATVAAKVAWKRSSKTDTRASMISASPAGNCGHGHSWSSIVREIFLLTLDMHGTTSLGSTDIEFQVRSYNRCLKQWCGQHASLIEDGFEGMLR